MKKLIVVAIGGNSLIRDSEHTSVFDQYQACGVTSRHLGELVRDGWRVVVTHGNGPQVGFILLRSDLAKDVLHTVPLDTCGADTQGALGYQIAQTLGNDLWSRGIHRTVVSVVTQCVVERDDPAFEHPSKPIGPFYTEEVARRHQEEDGWMVREDSGRGWRRVVPSPEPKEIVEEEAIKALLDQNMVVVAAGGGGIPVIRLQNKKLQGVAAVIDKDLTSSLLAGNLGADVFLISTGVDKVALNFGTPQQEDIDEMTMTDAVKHLESGQFPAGSMKPKIEAAIRFLQQGGQRVIITHPERLGEAVRGRNGTHIIPG